MKSAVSRKKNVHVLNGKFFQMKAKLKQNLNKLLNDQELSA